MGLTAAALAIYGGAALRSALWPPLETAEAVSYSAGQVLTTTGWIIREELALTAESLYVTPAAEEGARAARGQTIAWAYETAAAQTAARKLAAVEARIALLQASGETENAADLVRQLAEAVQLGTLPAADAAGAGLSDLLTGSADAAAAALEALEAEAERLAALCPAQALTAPAAGIFSAACDGLEAVLTPEGLEGLTAADLADLTALAEAPAGGYGRLITGERWYLAVLAGEEAPAAGETVQVLLEDSLDCTMTVLQTDPDGLVILESSERAADTVALRQVSARLTYGVCQGLLVPAEAVRYDADGQAGVYIVEAGCAVWKQIAILQTEEESCIAALDTSSTGNLWPGDEVIVTGRELYDGKVVG